jgi:hypothetical protein
MDGVRPICRLFQISLGLYSFLASIPDNSTALTKHLAVTSATHLCDE